MTEEQKKHIVFSAALDEKELLGFNLYQTYTGMTGWVSIVTGVVLIGLGIAGFLGYTNLNEANQWYAFVYIAIGIVIIAYIPVSLRGRVKATLKRNEGLAKPLNYDISEDKIAVSQDGASAELQWDQIYKMVGNAKRVLIYSNRMNAYVIPAAQLGEDNYRELKALADQMLPGYRNKMKAV